MSVATPGAWAQATPSLSIRDSSLVPTYPSTRLEAAQRLSRVVNVAWSDAPLAEVFTQIEETAGLTIVSMWLEEGTATSVTTPASPAQAEAPATSPRATGASDTRSQVQTPPKPVVPLEQRVGLSREARITLRAERVTLQHALELALAKADARSGSSTIGSTWQIGTSNVLQVGPRERLDRFVRVDTYDVANVIQVIRDFRYEGPKFVREASTSAFPDHAGVEDTRSHSERAEALRQMIMDICEPASWIELGGTSATIRYDRGAKAMVVRAPDYVHRAIDGYRWDPGSEAEIGEPVPVSPAVPTTPPSVPAGS
ncbi:MAG TPA: hypothetical protein VK157_12855 [Phycisphaerales bacterium]|nr:hypothetical protein [Phycisphaerales bacterium]